MSNNSFHGKKIKSRNNTSDGDKKMPEKLNTAPPLTMSKNAENILKTPKRDPKKKNNVPKKPSNIDEQIDAMK